MSTALAEVSEASAEGTIKTIYGDIKDTFRVPIVNLVFRVLATHPDYLQVAWRNLKPNAQTVFFERCADALRAAAVEGVSGLGQPPRPPDSGEAASVLRVFHYVNPKLLLAVGALRSATYGLQPMLAELPRDAKRQIARGVPEGMPPIEMIEPDEAEERVRSVFDDIKATLGLSVVNSDYRALARWPDYLVSAWGALKPVATGAEYRRIQRDLRRRTEEAITTLPFRMDLYPHALRHCGLSERDIESVQATLDSFYSLLPGLIANTAFLSVGSEGKEGAVRSPFPGEVL